MAFGGGGAAVGGASVGRRREGGVGLGLQVGEGRLLPLGRLPPQRLPEAVGGGAGRHVGAGADGARSPPLLADVRAVAREALPVAVTFDLGGLQEPRLLFDLQEGLGADHFVLLQITKRQVRESAPLRLCWTCTAFGQSALNLLL